MSTVRDRGNEDCEGPLHPKAVEGMELFNRGHYFEAHEALEAAWREETGPVRNLYRGILQVGVTYLHITRRNYAGAIKVHRRCRKWLDLWSDTCRGVEVGQLKADLERVMEMIYKAGSEHIGEFDLEELRPIAYKVREGE